ncbi:WXG100 family type VII secretion target [Streptomyces sp. TLI_146]|uniref:WXG100 family type VII secretion target n=1 Tax=Streptomyces sp. TLI_146 TaxID=1938858 RepID=UPI000C7099B6|nr:hypothetical protein [Streptomyces sp. TLI_146]PKV86227.1 hypothetical protein BX283_3788 [Streptomyces sp. TLI_146]
MSDDKLPEPSQLPLSPDELKRHHSEWAAGVTKAPPADSYVDPLTPVFPQPGPPLTGSPLLKPPLQGPSLQGPPLGGSPFLKPPVQGPPQDALRIAPGVLTAAAGRADEIHTDFTKPAAALEDPAQKASAAMDGWESAKAIRTAGTQWEKQAGTVAGWLARISESLRVGARDYHATDHAVDESLRGIAPRRSKLEGL